MALEVEGIVHGGMNAQKALGRCIDARAHNARARGTGSWAGGSGRALADRFAYENTHLSYWAVKMMGDKLSDRTPVEEPEKSGRRV